MYYVGKIINTHGIKGYLRAQFEVDLLSFFEPKQKFYINNFLFELVSLQNYKKNFFLLKLKDLNNLNQAKKIKFCDIYINNKYFSSINNFYSYQELIDKSVYNEKKVFLGEVKFIIKVPQGYLLEIKKKCGNTSLVPFLNYFVKEVNIDNIIIKTIEGLI
ncbi:ribosome maturation factor RimM [Candidatus Phytoplasma prunorum]|uniref:ribosome maturation factor RimM n=1 Tax=Candidatus Phytoplasma prunorum TaxID=47565 RepID=UPI002FEEA281